MENNQEVSPQVTLHWSLLPLIKPKTQHNNQDIALFSDFLSDVFSSDQNEKILSQKISLNDQKFQNDCCQTLKDLQSNPELSLETRLGITINSTSNSEKASEENLKMLRKTIATLTKLSATDDIVQINRIIYYLLQNKIGLHFLAVGALCHLINAVNGREETTTITFDATIRDAKFLALTTDDDGNNHIIYNTPIYCNKTEAGWVVFEYQLTPKGELSIIYLSVDIYKYNAVFKDENSLRTSSALFEATNKRIQQLQQASSHFFRKVLEKMTTKNALLVSAGISLLFFMIGGGIVLISGVSPFTTLLFWLNIDSLLIKTVSTALFFSIIAFSLCKLMHSVLYRLFEWLAVRYEKDQPTLLDIEEHEISSSFNKHPENDLKDIELNLKKVRRLQNQVQNNEIYSDKNQNNNFVSNTQKIHFIEYTNN